ncbi:virulence RhuM family protein, partial [Prevotella intermedia]|uniref:virulence RhuM family protein n=1 Tax=Prevotella intermedia TaxID=28131 RepID=UPI00211B8119
MYLTTFYNLDMIIALGYRVRSIIATRFRQWATQRLKEYITKGFTTDYDRLKEVASSKTKCNKRVSLSDRCRRSRRVARGCVHLSERKKKQPAIQ